MSNQRRITDKLKEVTLERIRRGAMTTDEETVAYVLRALEPAAEEIRNAKEALATAESNLDRAEKVLIAALLVTPERMSRVLGTLDPPALDRRDILRVIRAVFDDIKVGCPSRVSRIIGRRVSQLFRELVEEGGP